MPRPLPRSTPSPYTTLFRSQVKDSPSVALGETPKMVAPIEIRAAVKRSGVQAQEPREEDDGRRVVLNEIGHFAEPGEVRVRSDRKSTRLNSSHRCISYAVFC